MRQSIARQKRLVRHPPRRNHFRLEQGQNDMAAAEHERSRSIESLEQYDGRAGKAGQNERDHEERGEQRESGHAGASRNRKPQLRGGQSRLATAKTKSGDRPERNRRNLPEGAPDDDDDDMRQARSSPARDPA